MIKSIIFDIGNVLVDFNWKDYLNSFPYSNATKEIIAKAMFLSPEWNELDRGLLSYEELITAFTKNSPEHNLEIRSVFETVGKCIHQFDYAIPWIKVLKKSKMNVYVLSNYGEHMYNQTIEQLSFLQYTDGGILSYRDRVIKPDPFIYELLLTRYNIEPKESVFLDDNLTNVQAAMAFGISGIHFTSYKNALKELEELGVAIN